MEPDLRLRYNSGDDNGPLGIGWSLDWPSIRVDTRWGVPRYAAETESETYLFEGEQLYPTAHRGELRDREPEKIFYSRIERSFDRIIRHGDGPTNYWWEVIHTNGTRHFYGGRPGTGVESTAVLTDATGDVAEWALVESRDLAGNFIRYETELRSHPGTPGGRPGVEWYPTRVRYTGHGQTEGAFEVQLRYTTDLGEAIRPDVQVDLALGLKRVTAELLREIEVRYRNEVVRRYELTYTTGAFSRQLLAAVIEFDREGAEFYRHTFAYYDDVRTDAGYEPYGPEENWSVPDDNIRAGLLTNFPAFEDKTSVLGGARSFSWSTGGALTIGANDFLLFSKDKTAGITFDYSNTEDEGLIALVDINGDGLPDKLMRKGDRLQYRANLAVPGGTAGFADELRPVHGVQFFSQGKSNSYSPGVEANPPFGFVGSEFIYTTITTEVYFSDFNGDGLLDLCDKGTVLFSYIDENGDPVFTPNSGLTPSPIPDPGALDMDLFEVDPQEREDFIDRYPLHDVVRMWQAPYSGTIDVAAPARLLSANFAEADQYGRHDGVRLGIQLRGQRLWETTIEPDDATLHTPAGLTQLAVSKGDRLYFRAQSRFDGAFDRVEWDPEIVYTDLPAPGLDANGRDPRRYRASEDFLVAAPQTVEAPVNGTIRLAGTFTKPITTDTVRLRVYRTVEIINGIPVRVPLLEQIYPCDSTVQELPIEIDIPVLEGDELSCELAAATDIRWETLRWNPFLYYTAADPDTIPVFGPDGEPLIAFCPAVAYTMHNEVWRRTPLWINTTSDTVALRVVPRLQVSDNYFDPEAPAAGTARFSIKDSRCVRARQSLAVTGGAVATPPDSLIVAVAPQDTLFFEFHCPDWDVAYTVTEARVDLVDPAAGGNATSVPAGLFSGIAAADEIFGPLYRGWGHFAYNGNRERADEPIDEAALTMEFEVPEEIPEDSTNLDGLDDPSQAPFAVLLPDPKLDRWMGYEVDIWLAAGVHHPSRLGEDNFGAAPPPPSGAGLTAPSRETRIYGGAAGAGTNLVSASTAWAITRIERDVVDFNGDRYPDITTPDRVQYTNNQGGRAETRNHGLGTHAATSGAGGLTAGGSFVSTRAANSGEMKGGGSNRRASKSRRTTGKAAKSSRNATKTAIGGAGFTGGVGVDGDWASQSWQDVNGDGLPDKVYRDGTTHLNYGYSFGPPENWGYSAIAEGLSYDFSAGVGLMLYNGSIAGGISVTRTESWTTEALEDVNDDGLPDLLLPGDPFRVRLNTGTGFGPPVTWAGLERLDESEAVGESVNAAFTACVPIFVVKVCVNPSGSVGRGVSRTHNTLNDIDGDGYSDLLYSDEDGELRVRRSRINRTNLLRTVTGPLGESLTLDYQSVGSTYDLPYTVTTLSSLIIDDGVAADGPVQQQRFVYENGRHDRHERLFYGFGTVRKEELANDTVARETVYTYDVSSYYRKGLLLAETVRQGPEQPYWERRYTYGLFQVETGAELGPEFEVLANDGGAAFPALRQMRELHYAGGGVPGAERVVDYEYDRYGNLVRMTDRDPAVPAERLVVTTEYHHRDEVYFHSEPARVVISDGSGAVLRQRETELDEEYAIVRIRQPYDGGEAVWDLDYDEYGNLIRLVKPENHQGQRLAYDYELDAAVRTYVTAVTDSYGFTSEQTFDPAFGQLTRATDVSGNWREYGYDARGRLVTEQSAGNAAAGLPYDYQYTYHAAARPAYAEWRRYDPEHTADWLRYVFVDGFGREVQTQELRSVEGQERLVVSGRIDYDALGRPRAEYPATDRALAGGPTFQATPSTSPPLRTRYDALDRPTGVTLADGAAVAVAYAFAEDPEGVPRRATRITDARGHVQTHLRDAWGRTRARSAASSAAPAWERYGYNPLGELRRVTTADGATATFRYDQLGRLREEDHPDRGLTSFHYDAAGNLTAKVSAAVVETTPNGGEVVYSYDYERLVRVDYPIHPENQIRLHYGEPGADHHRGGRVWLQEDGSGGQEYFFDRRGRVTKTIRTLLINQANVPTFVSEASYDSWGRTKTLTYPDGEVVTYRYDRGGLPAGLSGEKDGRSYAYVRAVRYNRFDQRTTVEFGNDRQTAYAYADARGRLTRQEVAGLYRFDYDYDEENNLLSLINDLDPGTEIGGRVSHDFAYDAANRLASGTGFWQGASGDHGYQVDIDYGPGGLIRERRLKRFGNDGTAYEEDWLQQYTYEATPARAPAATGRYDFIYDAAGRPFSRREDGSTRNMIWDEENRLLALADDGYVSRYSYDAGGELVISSHGPSLGVFLDATPAGAINHHRDNWTAHVNRYLTVRQEGFTKHFFLGDERILSKTGTGQFVFGLLPPVTGVTAGNLDYASRMRLLEAALKEYYASLQVPPGHPTLPGYYAQPGQSGDPIPPLEISQPNNRPPADWPQPQGPPDPDGPPGHPVWYTPPPGNDSISAGYGYISDFAIPEQDRFFYHYDLAGNVQYVTNAAGEPVRHRQHLPFGTEFVDQAAIAAAGDFGFRGWRRHEQTGLLSFGDRQYDPATQLWLQPQLQDDARAVGAPYTLADQQPWLTEELRATRPSELLELPATDLGNPLTARAIAAGGGPAFATPLFDVGTAGTRNFDFKKSEDDDPRRKRKRRNGQEPESGPTDKGVSTPGSPGDASDPGEVSRQKKTGRYRAAYKLFRDFLSPQRDGAAPEAAAERRRAAQQRRKATYRKFTIRPGDWEGATVPGNRSFAFRPDGSTETLRKRQKVRRRRRGRKSPI
jgi:YD repeat-containing protein